MTLYDRVNEDPFSREKRNDRANKAFVEFNACGRPCFRSRLVASSRLRVQELADRAQPVRIVTALLQRGERVQKRGELIVDAVLLEIQVELLEGGLVIPVKIRERGNVDNILESKTRI
jgi:hypothetical protein